MLFYNKNGVQQLKTLNNPIKSTTEQRLCQAMIDMTIDESLRPDSYSNKNTKTDAETILQAREDITSPWFEAACMSAYGIDSSAIVEMLQDLWESADPVEMERVRRNYAAQSQRYQAARIEGQRKRTMEEDYEA
jgi:hypothetical protein